MSLDNCNNMNEDRTDQNNWNYSRFDRGVLPGRGINRSSRKARHWWHHWFSRSSERTWSSSDPSSWMIADIHHAVRPIGTCQPETASSAALFLSSSRETFHIRSSCTALGICRWVSATLPHCPWWWVHAKGSAGMRLLCAEMCLLAVPVLLRFPSLA